MDRFTDRKVLVGIAAAVVLLGASSLWFNRRKRIPPKKTSLKTQLSYEQAIKNFQEAFLVSKEHMLLIKQSMEDEFKLGLSKVGENDRKSSIKMLPSYVDVIPSGKEMGVMYALDIGGTNIRTLKCELDGYGNIKSIFIRKRFVSDELQKGSAEQLFDFIAACVSDILDDVTEENKIGFTFSFPMDQSSIDSGVLIKWTKGYTTSGVEGNDIVHLLSEAFRRAGINAKITALINDTVGTLIASAYEVADHNTMAGVILGTGTNACYVEQKANILKLEPQVEEGVMIINTEWGNFDSPEYNVLRPTQYDIVVDKNSPNYSSQHFEKMVSGMYLGEIVRLALLELSQSKLFSHNGAPPIITPHMFGTAYLSEIQRDDTPKLENVEALMNRIGLPNTTYDERRLLKELCHAVALRSARLVASAIAAIVDRVGKKETECVVAVDGSLYEHYPGYGDNIQEGLRELGFEHVILRLTKDGSGNGAAVAACVMSK